MRTPVLPPIEAILTVLLNEMAAFPDDFALVLDDYHAIDAKPIDASESIDDALTFLIEHLPRQMHLVIATREDPNLPLAPLIAIDRSDSGLTSHLKTTRLGNRADFRGALSRPVQPGLGALSA